MPRREGQKIKMLALLDIFTRMTDEEHPIGVPRLLELLEERGVQAERKSIYDDIEALKGQGYDIMLRRGRGGGYYMGEGRFELAELKLLVDAVQASKFITRRKSQRLVEKLAGFTSKYRAQSLNRNVLVSGRVKARDESIYYWVDAVHSAIEQNRQISFQYRDWTLDKEMTPRHGGKSYTVSPWALAWESGNYYLIAYDNDHEELRHYRVDKMTRVQIQSQPREGAKAYREFDVTAYVQQMFNMYGGPLQQVCLRCDNGLAGAMIDRFGTGPTLVPEEDGEHFHIHVDVRVSPTFYGWVAGFRGGVEILSPESVRTGMKELAEKLAAQYRTEE